MIASKNMNPPEEERIIELDDERDKHKRRAERFGVEYIDPSTKQAHEGARHREHHPRSGFATGIDIFTEEEVAKKNQRAARFGLETQGLNYNPPQVPEDETKRRQRAERFGTTYEAPDDTGLMEVDLFEQRKDPGPDIQRRLDAIHVYGIDLLSTSDIFRYFTDYGPTFVEWLNDSSCNVIFRDDGTAKRALAGLGRPLPADQAIVPEGMDVTDPQNMIYLWHKGVSDLKKSGSDVPVIFRMSTVEDVKPAGRVESRRLWQTAGGGGGGQSRRGGGGGVGKVKGKGRTKYRPYGGGDGNSMDIGIGMDDGVGDDNDNDNGYGRGGRGRRERRRGRGRGRGRLGGGDREYDGGGNMGAGGGGVGGSMFSYAAMQAEQQQQPQHVAPTGPPRDQVVYDDL